MPKLKTLFFAATLASLNMTQAWAHGPVFVSITNAESKPNSSYEKVAIEYYGYGTHQTGSTVFSIPQNKGDTATSVLNHRFIPDPAKRLLITLASHDGKVTCSHKHHASPSRIMIVVKTDPSNSKKVVCTAEFS